MYITYCDKFVQIELAQGSRLLQKVLQYANKHFSKRYHLSSSLLILDDGERFKKDYLINWTYHATMQSVYSLENTQESALQQDSLDTKQEDAQTTLEQNPSKQPKKQKRKSNTKKATTNPINEELDSTQEAINPHNTNDSELAKILSYSHLPIRIKITNPNTLLKRVKVQIHLSNLGQILVRLQENNRVARRYIHALFGSNILYEVDNEFCISAVGYTQSMWDGIMGLISSRIIHNIALDFEFNTSSNGEDCGESSDCGSFGSGFDSFLTREEYLLRKCYSELNVDYKDDFAQVKKQYLKLAKKFHPDNAQGKDGEIVQIFEERFKRISQAYNTIKAATCHTAVDCADKDFHNAKTTA